MNILYALERWMGNYGLAVIVFTLIVRVVLFPFDFKSRKSMRKVTALQPKMAVLQKKYANDKDKLNRKLSELYKQEGVSPLSGCLPMLLSYPILILMFNAMRFCANDQMVIQVAEFLAQGGTAAPAYKDFLWIKNLYMADNPFVSAIPGQTSLAAAADSFRTVLTVDRMQGIIAAVQKDASLLEILNRPANANLLAMWNDIVEKIASAPTQDAWVEFLRSSKVLIEGEKQVTTTYMAQLPTILESMVQSTQYFAKNCGSTNLNVILLGTIQKDWNGLLILPVLSAVSQFVMTKLTPQQPTAASADAQATQSTGKFMTWFFPIFSLWICFSSTAAFALYWVASNLLAMAQTVAVNKYLEKKEKTNHIAGEGIVQ